MKSRSFANNKLLCFFIFGYLILPFQLISQIQVDSLNRLIDTQADDTSKVGSYLALHEELKYENPSASSDLINKALSLSEALGFQKGEVKSWIALGDFLHTNSNYDSALTVYIQAQNIAQTLQDRSLLVEAFYKQGNTLNDLGRLEEADSIISVALKVAMEAPLDSSLLAFCYNNLGNNAFANNQYDKALELYQKTLIYNIDNDRLDAVVSSNIGLIHFSQGDYATAEKYFQAGLASASAINETRVVAQSYNNLGMAKRGLGEYEEARRNYYSALEHFETVNDLSNMAHVHTNLSNIHKDLGEYEQAIDELEKCLQLLNQVNYPLGECYTLNNLGELHFRMKDYKKAETYFLQAKERSISADVLLINTDASRFLSLVYDSLGDFKNAYEYHIRYKALDDSLKNQTNKSRMAELEEKYQNEQKQQEIELLSAENQIASLQLQKQESFRNYLIVATFLLLLLTAVVYNRYQIKARANDKLKELDHLKSNFFTNISHEFRTPLTLILSPIQKLLQKTNDHEISNELLIIHRNASRLTELINQLMDLSKLEAGELKLKISENNLKELLQVSAASFESLAEAQHLQFHVRINGAPTLAFYDEDKILKVLNNLLSNAFKFTPKGGNVILEAELKDNIAYISVTDTGLGIAKEDQELIFQRFYQSSSYHSITAGTGVGLTLSKEFALLHKGDIEIESNKGEGTRFTFYFPISKNAYPPSTIVESQFTSPIALERINRSIEPGNEGLQEHELIILIVEDNADLRQHITSLLKDSFTVKHAVNGKEGISIAEEIVPDIIISDLMMPEVDGAELCNTLKSNDRTSHIPIVLLTAKADRETKLSGLKTGADDFLTKPFDNEELIVRVNNLIDQRKKLQEKFARKITLSPSNIEVESPNDRFIRKALETVDKHLSNSEFTVEQFQDEMAMSRMQLHRKLKALTGFSASEFIRDIRLQRAADLLGQNGINITEVAYSCGFNSSSYFTQRFKEKYGTSPSKYLKKDA